MDLRWFDSIPSTQELAHQLGAEGAAAGTALVARVQTEGRGRRGRAWASPPGGLWLSVVCRPPAGPAVEVLSLRVALAVADAVEACVPGVHFGIKWPNDLMLGSRKVGGILCEARWQGPDLTWVAVGVGLNVENPVPVELDGLATTLSTIAPEATVTHLAQPVAEAVMRAGMQRGPLGPEELASYARRDTLRGRHLLEPANGVALGLAADGGLLVGQGAGRTIGVRSGTVVLADE